MALQGQACSSSEKQRYRADKAMEDMESALPVTYPLCGVIASVFSLTRSAKLNGKVVAAIFPK